MKREHFELLVAEAVHTLPEEFRERLDNIDVVVEAGPTAQQLAGTGLAPDDLLLGLYEGVPLTERSAHYGLVPPDKISIFQGPIEQCCANDAEIRAEVQMVVRHEIAHHFGLDDQRLHELGR